MSNKNIELSSEDIELLHLLGESFMHIRAIANRGANSSLTDKQKLDLIGDIADASHNIPNVLSQGGSNSNLSFLLGDVPRLKTLIKR